MVIASVIIGILLIIGGISCMAAPIDAYMRAAHMLAILLFVYGIYGIISFFKRKLLVPEFIVSILAVVIGFVYLFRPGGTPPAGNANYAWIQHMIYHLAPNGKIGLVLANGALSTQTSGEGEIRRKIIEDDLIEGIVALPTQLFYSVTIPVTLWFISKNKKQPGKTLFIDARNMGHMVDRKHRDFSDDDIAKFADTFSSFQNGTLQDVKGFCAAVSTETIAKQDYILTPGRYVGIEEKNEDDEPFDDKMKRLTSELGQMFAQSHELEDQIKQNLGAIGFEINEGE